MKKSKKVGICHRTLDEHGDPGNLYLTDGALRSAIRSSLRKLWTSSTRRIFIESVRFEYMFTTRRTWAVKCNECDEIMGLSKREYVTKKDGSQSKKMKLLYEIDHLTGSPGFDKIYDLSMWADNLFYGQLQVLCRGCHGRKTYK